MKNPLHRLYIISGLLGALSCPALDEIPEAGRFRIDGRLDEWEHAVWVPLVPPPDTPAGNLSSGEWTVAWCDDAMLVIALRYHDAQLTLEDRFVAPHAQDGIEVFVRGDPGSNPSTYAETQESAQHYIFGLAKDRKSVWKQLGPFERFPVHNPARAAIRIDGQEVSCEIIVPLYDRFDAQNRRRTSETEVYPGIEIGIDVLVSDATTGPAAPGMLSSGAGPVLRIDADAITIRTLVE